MYIFHSFVFPLYFSGGWSSVSTCVTEWSSTSSSLPPTHLGEVKASKLLTRNCEHEMERLPPVFEPFSRLNLRELGPMAAHMRWFVWFMAAAGTVYVFKYHEK